MTCIAAVGMDGWDPMGYTWHGSTLLAASSWSRTQLDEPGSAELDCPPAMRFPDVEVPGGAWPFVDLSRNWRWPEFGITDLCPPSRIFTHILDCSGFSAPLLRPLHDLWTTSFSNCARFQSSLHLSPSTLSVSPTSLSGPLLSRLLIQGICRLLHLQL